MRARKPFLIALQAVLITAVVVFAWRTLAPVWGEFENAWATLHFRARLLIASGFFVAAAYVVLIETWRRVVAGWGGRIPFRAAARIWFVSNLGRYLPGKVWSIAAMGAMAQQSGVAPAVAVGSALYINVLNLLAGFAVCLICAPGLLGIPPVVTLVFGIGAALFVFVPHAIPVVVKWTARRFGRSFELAPLPYSTIALTFLSCALAWCFYGVAFQLLGYATMDHLSGATSRYVALYTGSYLAGYVAPIAAGGLGVREMSLVALATRDAFMTTAQIAVLAVVSRIWLTFFELIPGLVLLLFFTPKRPTPAAHETRPA